MLSWRLLSAALCAWLVTSCTGTYEVVDDEGSGADAAGGPDSAASRAMFDSEMEPLFAMPRPKGACIGCHQGTDAVNGPDFLGPDASSHYDTLHANRTLVGLSPEVSPLYTKPDHTGNTWCRGTDIPYSGCAADESATVAAWINLENGN